MNTKFQSPNLQREIILKKINNFFFNFHQLIYSSSSISWPSLKLLAVIVFEISWLQIFKVLIFKGRLFKKNKNNFF